MSHDAIVLKATRFTSAYAPSRCPRCPRDPNTALVLLAISHSGCLQQHDAAALRALREDGRGGKPPLGKCARLLGRPARALRSAADLCAAAGSARPSREPAVFVDRRVIEHVAIVCRLMCLRKLRARSARRDFPS